MLTIPGLPEGKSLVLYDGECGLCSQFVQFILKRDSRRKIYFASLHSEVGKYCLERLGIQHLSEDTFVFIEEENWSIKSTAALNIVKYLKGAWPLLSIFKMMPVSWRDSLYSFVAKRRKRWFQSKEACQLRSEDESRRILS